MMAKELVVQKDKFIWMDKAYEKQDFLTRDFYRYSDEVVERYKVETVLENELFYTFIQPVLAFEQFLNNNAIDKVIISDSSLETYYIIIAACENSNVQYSIVNSIKLLKIKQSIKNKFLWFASIGYLLLHILLTPYTGSIKSENKVFSIIRLQQSVSKMRGLLNRKDISFDYENIQNTLSKNKKIVEGGTVYHRFKRTERIAWLFRAAKNSLKELDMIEKFLAESVNKMTGKAARDFYSVRMVHTMFFGEMIESYFSYYEGCKYITGNIIDRYAMTEARIAQKHNIKIYTIPHGIEYGFKLPYGLVGDVFYTTSEYAASFFNEQYKIKKFVFSKDVAEMMFNYGSGGSMKERKVVFFSEAHEIEVNKEIIKGLYEGLESADVKLYVKLHPRENKMDYADLDTQRFEYVDSFEHAIKNNICISRRSTTLVEALYNNSTSLAILLNTNDEAVFYNYPSLLDDKISRHFTIDALIERIKSEL